MVGGVELSPVSSSSHGGIRYWVVDEIGRCYCTLLPASQVKQVHTKDAR